VVLSSVVPSESLEGLEGFSHVWVTFVFHLNTNARRNAMARGGDKGVAFAAKITPPMLK
jgi:tRNA (Thr-GGU) A37 N-methylase